MNVQDFETNKLRKGSITQGGKRDKPISDVIEELPQSECDTAREVSSAGMQTKRIKD